MPSLSVSALGQVGQGFNGFLAQPGLAGVSRRCAKPPTRRLYINVFGRIHYQENCTHTAQCSSCRLLTMLDRPCTLAPINNEMSSTLPLLSSPQGLRHSSINPNTAMARQSSAQSPRLTTGLWPHDAPRRRCPRNT